METAKNAFSRIGFSYLSMAIAAIGAQMIIAIVLLDTNPQILSNQDYVTIITSICQYLVPIPILYLLLRKIRPTEIRKRSLSLKTVLVCISVTIALMYVGNIIGMGITDLIALIKQNQVANPIVDLINSSDILVNLLLISIIAPIFEEMFFRKLLIDRTIRYGARISILLSALMFGLFHGNLNPFFYAFLLGGFFASVYVKTGKIIYPILLHITANLFGSVFSVIFGGMTEALGASVMGILVNLGYLAVMFVIVAVGLYYIYKWSRKFIELKDSIENPLKTSLLNAGMICFIAFCIFEIISTLLI